MTARQNTRPCYIVSEVGSGGAPWPEDSDPIPHYHAGAEAEVALAEERKRYLEDLDGPTDVDDLVKLELVAIGLCWIVTCDGDCGNEWEGDGGGTHLDDPVYVVDYSDWTRTRDGRYLCESCPEVDVDDDRTPGPGQEALL